MAKRGSKKAAKPSRIPSPGLRLGAALAKCTKAELIDVLVGLARDDRAVFRRLATRFELQSSPDELLILTRQAIVEATAFDERHSNYNFDYDYDAYAEVQRNLHRLIEMGQLQSAMELSLELMASGSRQVEMSDEGLMTEDMDARDSHLLFLPKFPK